MMAEPIVNHDAVADAVVQLLHAIGADPMDPNVIDTPDRVARWWAEFIDYDPGNVATTFESVHADQMVVVSGIEVWSLCAHHLLPFSASVTIGYLANDRILGLSKFARIAHRHAHRLNTQEDLVERIADEVQEVAGTGDVAVTASGVHLCMAARGIRTPATMTTSVNRGKFREHGETRAEFFALIKGG